MRSPLFVPLAALLLLPLGGCLKAPDSYTEAPRDAAPAPTSAGEVIARHVAAIGGEEALRALPQRTIEARLVLRADEGCEETDGSCLPEDQTGSFFYQSTSDGRMYQRSVIGGGVEERGFDGKLGWALVGEDTMQVDTPEEAALSQEEAWLHWYFGVEDRKVELTLLPPRQEDSLGRVVTLDGVQWRVANSPVPKEMWFDRATGLLREEVVRNDEVDPPQSQIIVYDDYRPIDEVLVAHHIQLLNKVGEEKQVIEFVTQKVHHQPIEEGRFAIPELSDPEPKPDPLLARLRETRAAAEEADDDTEAQLEWARTAFLAARFDEARRAVGATLTADPREPEALLLSARLHLLRGDHRQAQRALESAGKAGVRPEVIAREQAWIHHRERDYRKLADALDLAGSAVLAGRYRAFAGKPLEASIEGDPCRVDVAFGSKEPLAIVPLEIDGTETQAILDTGAADLILTESLAEKLGVTVHSRTKIGEGLPEVGHGQTDEVTVGSLTLRNVPVNVFDDRAIAQMAGEQAPQVGAVLGVGLLRDFLVQVDVPQGRLTLVPTGSRCKKQAATLRRGPSAPLLLGETHYVYLPAQMNGAEGVYLLNTGMRGADMAANQFAHAHAGIGAPPLRTGETPLVTVDELTLAEGVTAAKVSSAYGVFAQSQTSDGYRLDGMIGLRPFATRPFVLDFEQLRLHFPPPDAG